MSCKAVPPAALALLAALLAAVAALALAAPSPAAARSKASSAAERQAREVAAPRLRAKGGRLAWSHVGRMRRYVLASKRPGRRTAYRVVAGTSVTPPAVPGATMTYGLRTNVRGSRWAREVRIAYPAAGGRPKALTPSGERAPAAGRPAGSDPTPGEAPVSPRPVGERGAFEVGLVSGADAVGEARATGRLGAGLVRVEFGIRTPVAQMRAAVAAHAANGTRVLLLAGFHGTMPTAAEARNLAAWAREFGPGGDFWAGRGDGRLAVREIEFGNETSYGYQYGDDWDAPTYGARAREYARRFRDAHEAVKAANPRVGLLAQADDGDTGSANWVDGMFAAVPDLAERVAGWTLHPYGPRWEARFARLAAQTRAAGASPAIPIWVTEYGLATDDGRCLSDNYGWDRCMSYAAAGSALRGAIAGMRAAQPRLRAVLLYQGHDQRPSGTTSEREHYFGALRADLGEKGAFSAAVRSLLAG